METISSSDGSQDKPSEAGKSVSVSEPQSLYGNGDTNTYLPILLEDLDKIVHVLCVLHRRPFSSLLTTRLSCLTASVWLFSGNGCALSMSALPLGPARTGVEVGFC